MQSTMRGQTYHSTTCLQYTTRLRLTDPSLAATRQAIMGILDCTTGFCGRRLQPRKQRESMPSPRQKESKTDFAAESKGEMLFGSRKITNG